MIEAKILENKIFLENLKAEIDKLILEDNDREAYTASKEIEASLKNVPEFERKFPDLYREYQNLIIKLKWLALSILMPDQIVKLFQSSFMVIFSIPEYNIWRKLKIALLCIVGLDPRDEFKKKLRDALLNNQEKITKKRIIIANKLEDPTVANWLRDYIREVGLGEINEVKRSQYLINSQNMIKTEKAERERLLILFSLFEKLKLSSQTLEGLEEDIPFEFEDIKGTIKQGVFEPFKITEQQKKIFEIASKVISESRQEKGVSKDLNKLAAEYPVGSLERKAIEEEIAKAEGGSKK